MPEWEAEIAIDEGLVRALLSDQFPELDAASARPLAEGWDNSVWVVEDEWAFRFPRREIAIPGVERELEVLPRIAALLAVPVPVPTSSSATEASCSLGRSSAAGCFQGMSRQPSSSGKKPEHGSAASSGGSCAGFMRRRRMPPSTQSGRCPSTRTDGRT